MTFETQCMPVFAGHQTFHPRFGWLKKAVDAVSEDMAAFSHESAPIDFGVGKNMVESIRFWAQAFGLILKAETGRTPNYVTTQFADAYFGDVGLDPYLEDETSLWILHWRALSAPSMLPVWWLAFNSFSALEFTEAELTQAIASQLESSAFKAPNISSIEKDVDCMIRMYCAKDLRGRQTWEDLLDSPFRSLGILQPSPGRHGAFRFKTPNSSHVPVTAIAFAALDYAGQVLGGAKVISLSRLVMDVGGPGRILRVGEEEIRHALEEVFADVEAGVKVVSAAGALMLSVEGDCFGTAHDLLVSHHAKRGIRKKSRRSTMLCGPESRQPSRVSAERLGQLSFVDSED